jgi:hypothetical protein
VRERVIACWSTYFNAIKPLDDLGDSPNGKLLGERGKK